VTDKKSVLRRNKAVASGLMIAAGILFVIARYQKGSGNWEWVAAFAEAAMIGALADWFAVVALFRHPLGIPIPHTAIVPNKKNAIADSLAEFIRDKFLATEALVTKLKAFNPADRLAGYLSRKDNAAGVAAGLTRVAAESLDFLDDSRVRSMLLDAVTSRVEKIDLSSTVGQLLEFLMKDNRHQGVLDEVLRRIAGWTELPESQEKITVAIDRWASNEYPLISRMIPNRDQFLKGAGEKIAKRINGYIQEVNADPNHELRQTFSTAVNELIEKLRNDPLTRGKIEAIKLEIMSNAPLATYIDSLWSDLKTWLRSDLTSQDSKIREKLAGAVVSFAGALAKSSDLRESINDHLENIVRNHADGLRTGFVKHVSGTIKQWEDDDFVSEIEMSIGSDLQFIRMNGTLVGGLIGLLIHAVSLLIG
jgi:uncharacterized membrane-anchored protein YjiN (DUF445 family)